MTPSEQRLRVACEALLAFIRGKYPEDFDGSEGARGFICPYHQAIADVLAEPAQDFNTAKQGVI